MRPRRDGCDSRYYVGHGAQMNSFFRELKERKVYRVALGYAVVALGDKERAIDEMERAYRDRAGNDIVFIKVNPMLDDLRGHLPFEALVQKVFSGKQ